MQQGLAQLAPHCLVQLRPDFASNVQHGDLLVAGANFGIGSSREQAASVLVHLGVAAVLAHSYSGLYFRNAFNVGLLLLTSEQAHQVREGDALHYDAHLHRVWLRPSLSAVVELPLAPIPPFLREMVRAGGLLPQLKQRFAARTPTHPTASEIP